MSFSDKYKTTLKISSALNSSDKKSVEEHLARWSADVVNELYGFFGNDHHFKVVITLDPNPSSMKGVDQHKIEIWQTQNRSDPGFKPFIKIMSVWEMTLGKCIADINEKIDILTKKDVPEVIEIHGRKYRLTEI